MKKADPVMTVSPSSNPTYGGKHPEDITGLTRFTIIFTIIIIFNFLKMSTIERC
jgi:hypothetical protein